MAEMNDPQDSSAQEKPVGSGAEASGEAEDFLQAASFEDPQAAGAATVDEATVSDADLELLLQQAAAGAVMPEPSSGMKFGGAAAAAGNTFDLPAFQDAGGGANSTTIDLLRDVELNVKIELGRSKMLVEDVLRLGEGSVVELDKLAGDPVDVFVNERLVARGEVLVLNDNFCVRVNEIVAAVRDDSL